MSLLQSQTYFDGVILRCSNEKRQFRWQATHFILKSQMTMSIVFGIFLDCVCESVVMCSMTLGSYRTE